MTNFIVSLVVVSLGLTAVYGSSFGMAAIIGGLYSIFGSGLPVLDNALLYANYSTASALIFLGVALLSGRLRIMTEDDVE